MKTLNDNEIELIKNSLTTVENYVDVLEKCLAAAKKDNDLVKDKLHLYKVQAHRNKWNYYFFGAITGALGVTVASTMLRFMGY